MKVLSHFLRLCLVFQLAATLFAQQKPVPKVRLKAYVGVAPARDHTGRVLAPAEVSSTLPVFTYNVTSSRDGNSYTGVMVGQDPFNGGGTTNVPTQIIPLIITTDSVAYKVSSSGILSTKQGSTTFDPTAPDSNCLAAPNNVALTLAQQSPIFQVNNFKFGKAAVGKTQYLDAYQRANFWQFTQGTNYHTLLSPVKTLAPVFLNLSGNDSLAVSPALFGSCGPLGIVNVNTLSPILVSLTQSLAGQGVNPSTFPIFLLYNVVMSGGSPANLNLCCILGFHGASGSPAQTFSPMDFDTTGLFGGIQDASILAHETGEWMDDPFGNNPTPAWGHIGQVPGCQGNLENGDPLTGTNVPVVKGANGFNYHLQELAFFSWFYGTPSIAANGWFSNNNTFTTDAGPPCQ